MKITVDIPENDLVDILRFSGEKKKGPAIAKFLATHLMLRRRRELTAEVLSGGFAVELPAWRDRRQREREHAAHQWEH
jgi:hypothetical protein